MSVTDAGTAPEAATATRAKSAASATKQRKAAKLEFVRLPAISVELVEPAAKQVFVAGSFNDWRPDLTPLAPLENGRWRGSLMLGPGRYEYLFVVDGHWRPDPNAAESVENPFGGRNSVVTVSV